MDFNYRNYVKRYHYQPFNWPPDLGLAQLHARCSEPGPANQKGVECPCCFMPSKKKVRQWWKRDIEKELSGVSTAIAGYFQLIKYYLFFCVLVLLINSLYPIYATYYTCSALDSQHDTCLHVGVLYYLQFNSLINLLQEYGRQDMIDILMILQSAVFYILLIANYFSIIFITFMNETAKRELKEQLRSEASRCLVFYNISKNDTANLMALLKEENEKGMNVRVVATMELFEVKKYYDNFNKRNKVYYYLLAMQVNAQNPLAMKSLNTQLRDYHIIVLEQKQKLHKFSHKVMVLFEDVETRKQVYRRHRLSIVEKWGYGIKSLLSQYNLVKLDHETMRITAYQIGIGSDVMWQNLGEELAVKMAIRIKTFFVALSFILICYGILYYPMVFSLKTHIKAETNKFVKLNTFEKILPNLTALALFGLSMYFRFYMEKLSERRNPKDQLEKARFVLITCLTFHVLFYIIIPTIFFMVPGEMSETVKLYVISEQARTFVVIQMIIVLVDLPFRLWKKKKVKALSDQRVAFKNNQSMLHKIVEARDYPLEIRLQVLFRIWSLVLFYSFFIPYIVFYTIVALVIFYWIQKRNLFKHYAIRRKVSIKLESETLMYFVNFFCVYLCIVYCFTVHKNSVKMVVAVTFTLLGSVLNIVYWFILNKAEDKPVRLSTLESNQVSLLQKDIELKAAKNFEMEYKNFLTSIQNDQLDEEITQYLKKVDQYQGNRESMRSSQSSQRGRAVSTIELSKMKPQGNPEQSEFTDAEDINDEEIMD